jgi:hypothetical protein
VKELLELTMNTLGKPQNRSLSLSTEAFRRDLKEE